MANFGLFWGLVGGYLMSFTEFGWYILRFKGELVEIKIVVDID